MVVVGQLARELEVRRMARAEPAEVIDLSERRR
jgi:hypothetical protein